MAQNAVNDETIGQTATRGDPRKGSGVLEDAQSLWQELRELSHDRFRLAALETQRAGDSLVSMLMAGVMVAVLLIGAWLGLLAAAVLWLVEHGVVASSAILLAVVFNLLLSLILCAVIRRKSRYLQFPATLRSLRPMPPERRDQEKS
ncbi:MAG: phage holin family protein [Methylobacter sp.]|nr:phage holin family protein [Methylobacter sp.]